MKYYEKFWYIPYVISNIHKIVIVDMPHFTNNNLLLNSN